MTHLDMDALRAEVEAKYGPPRLGPPPEPTLDDVRVGWTVFERVPDDSDYAGVRGGVVVDVGRAPDPDTGEVIVRYRLVRPYQGRLLWVTLAADRCQPPGRPNARTIRGLCEVAARELAKPNRRSVDDRRDLEMWSLGARLTSVLVAPGSPLP